MVRIHLPPADSVSLFRSRFRGSRTRLSARVCADAVVTALRYLEERPPVSVFFIPVLSIAIEVAFAAVLVISIGKTLRNTLRASSLLSS